METPAQSATKEEGLRLLKAGQVSDAIGILGSVVTSEPNDAAAHMYLGIACQQGGDSARAAHHLEESLRLKEDARAYYNLALVYESSGKVDDAKIRYRRALVVDPNYTNAQQALDRLTPAAQSAAVSLNQTQAVAPPPSMNQTQAVPPPIDPFAKQTFGPPPSFMDRKLQEHLKVQEAHNELLRNGLIYGSICGAILFVLLGLLGAFVQFAAVSAGSGILSLIISAVSGAIFGALVGLWMGYTAGDEMQGALAGAVLRTIYILVIGLIAGMPGFVLFTMAIGGAVGGAISGYIIGKLVDSSIGGV